MSKFWKFIKWTAIVGSFAGICCAIFIFVYVLRVTKDLPSVEVLSAYKPPIMTRVHAGDGKLISEFKKEARVFVPVETIPKELQYAFVAAEDKRFYSHDGFDEKGFARAMVANIGHVLKKERLEGGSTITQQVAKNFFDDDRTIARKIREVVLAKRIEKAMDKDHIIELYLNEIYFGRGAYGVAAASLNYFGKPMKDLSLPEMAYLAVLPKAPNNYVVDNEDRPDKKQAALDRRSYVLREMMESGFISPEAADAAKTTDIVVVDRFDGEEYLAAEYFVEEARKKIYSMYGEDELYTGGLSIRTTLDTDLQLKARRALRDGLEAYDSRHGYRGPIGHFDDFSDWKKRLAEFDGPKDIGDWRTALVMSAGDGTAEIQLKPDDDALGPDKGTIKIGDISWALPTLESGAKGKKPSKVTDLIKAGDIVLVEKKAKSEDAFLLRQIPEANGGIIAMDPHTGRILALVGGYSFSQSQFNRATQAYRQPGSSFKPFVYAAALDNGYTPASQVLDAPFVIERQDVECEEDEELTELELRDAAEDGQTTEGEEAEEEECERFYKPSNYAEGRFYGLSTLRLGLEKSRNAMTVRLANDMGMAPVMRYGTRFGIYDEVKPELAWALGAGETTLMRMATAYSMIVNGGKRVSPSILDRVQDGTGKTIFVNGEHVCETCLMDEWDGSAPPELPDEREQVIEPVTAYQVSFMLKGVVDNGTGVSIRSLGRPLAGKTGTTNDFYDAWFMGYSPDLVVGVYVGYDTPRPLNGESGSKAAVPIFKSFMQAALKNEAVVPFRIPEGVTLSPINRNTGEPSYIGAPDFILEAFKPGTEPRLGQLSQTIRVGSGSDSLISGGFEFDDEFEEDTPEDAQGEARTDERETDTAENNGEDSSGEGPSGESDSQNSEAADDAAGPKVDVPVKKDPPAPVPADEEDELDDGLY